MTYTPSELLRSVAPKWQCGLEAIRPVIGDRAITHTLGCTALVNGSLIGRPGSTVGYEQNPLWTGIRQSYSLFRGIRKRKGPPRSGPSRNKS